MSLYNDLTTVLTPYANKIKQNESDIGDIQDALEHLDVDTDKTLSIDGKPADAKAVGDALDAVTSDVGEVQDALENLNDAIIEKTISAPVYDSTSTYNVGDYCSKDGVIYKCVEPITTAEAWNASHWTAITGNEMIADMNDKLNMLVTSQVVEQPPAPEDVQCVNPADILSKSTATRMYVSKVDVSGNGIYYINPYNTATLFYIHLFNEYGEKLTITDRNGDQLSRISSIGGDNAWFTVENHRVLKTFVRNGVLANTFTASGDISYFGSPDSTMFFDTSNSNYDLGITYGEHYDEYIPYGDTPDVPVEYELNYNIELARHVQAYMQNHGTAVSNNMFNFFYPESDNTEFVNAVKYYHKRAERQRNRVIRIGSFNKFVSRGRSNWSTIKQELADYSIDICGFQECSAIVSDGAVTDQIGAYLQGWQYKGYAPQDTVVDKALVSHWEITHTDLITLLTRDDGTTSNCIHALMTISQNNYYSNVVSADATLSVYCYHGSSGGKTIGGTSYSSYQVRQMEINALLAILAQDTSDFIVIVGDTNAFETGFDIATGTHHEWEMFRNAGFTPVLEGTESTVTATAQNKYFCKADNDKVYCICCYDQIFVGANITAETYGVVDSNLYPVESLGSVPVSDHCMIYADLKFDFDAVMQAKLREIAITQPWW